MQLTFRIKLIALIAVAASSSMVVLWISVALSGRVQDQLVLIGERYVPQIELGPQLEQLFSKVERGFQDASAAGDTHALAATQELRAQFLDRLAVAGGGLDPNVSAKLRGLFESYYVAAYEAAERIIAGDTGETGIEAIRRMQQRHALVVDYLKKAMIFDKAKLVEAFEVALDAQRAAGWIRLFVSCGGVLLLCVLSFWIGHGTLRAVDALTQGFQRFGQGRFDEPIRTASNDELDQVAAQANLMAENLQRLASERERADWLKEGVAGLSQELHGELALDEVARRTLRFSAARADALVAAIYLRAGDDTLRLADQLAHKGNGAEGAHANVRLGEGLLGQAALGDGVVVISNLPANYLLVGSGLGQAPPSCLALVPFRRLGKILGIVEYAFLSPVTERELAFLSATQETVSLALEAAFSRQELHELLDETRRQAEQLKLQEEELIQNNKELLVQQEELRAANDELETHRNVLAQQNRQLEEAKQALQEKAEELARASAYKSQFVANMSHELRTPLNSMLLLSHLLAKNEAGNLTPKQVRDCETVYGAGKDLLALINQILDLAKIEAGHQEVYLERVSMQDLANHVSSVFAPLAAEKGLRFVVQIAEDAPAFLVTDQSRAERILTNLLGNAIKFTAHGSVSLRIGRPRHDVQAAGGQLLKASQTVAFSVADTGIGIPKEALERVFAPFEQLDAQTDRRYGGTGLGLAISRESARLLGGSLAVESVVHQGSTFTCYLPQGDEAEVHTERSRSAVPSPRSVADDRLSLQPGQPYLLAIEDDAILAEQLVAAIHARGLAAVVASTAAEGVEMIHSHKPLGIMLDVKLPDSDGFTLMARLRRDPNTRAIPVYFISGIDAPERGLALGAVGYLVKPVSGSDLVSAVRVLAPESSERSAHILVVEDNPVAAESIVRMLAEQTLTALHVTTASAAVEALRADQFSCVVLDLGLPDMDGLGLLESLSETPIGTQPPVIVYTARALTKEETRRLQRYVRAVVLKDGSSEQRLREELQRCVGPVREHRPSPPPSAPRAPAADVSLEGKKLLLADDDMRSAYSLSALLQGRGADVLVADNGRTALELLAQHPDLDAVLMDIMMPEMDGYEAIRRLREDRRNAALPVIALTAKALQGERERCIAAGASDYLAKPVDADQLLLLLDTWLQRA